MLVTISRNCWKEGGHKQQSISGEVPIFFLQTRNPLFSPCTTITQHSKISYQQMNLKQSKLQSCTTICGGINSQQILAREVFLWEEILEYMPMIQGHLSCFLSYLNEHVHLHNVQFPCQKYKIYLTVKRYRYFLCIDLTEDKIMKNNFGNLIWHNEKTNYHIQ